MMFRQNSRNFPVDVMEAARIDGLSEIGIFVRMYMPMTVSYTHLEKVGIEETKEILTNYLSRRERNLNRLVKYAETLKCGEILNNYLEVLV